MYLVILLLYTMIAVWLAYECLEVFGDVYIGIRIILLALWPISLSIVCVWALCLTIKDLRRGR